MGRGRNMRIRARRERLADLAKRDPAAFDKEWALRLDSWAGSAHRRAEYADAFSTVDNALAELSGCGVVDRAVLDNTRQVMTEAACSALAHVVDNRLYRLGNTAANCTKMRDGTHKI